MLMLMILAVLASPPPHPPEGAHPPPPASPPPKAAKPRPRPPAARSPKGPTVLAGAGLDPLKPARSGRIQCHNPDLANRRCESITRFMFLQDGGVVAVSDVRLGVDPLMILQTATPVTVREGMVCGDLKDSRVSQLTVNGGPARPEEVREVKGATQEAWREDFGKPRCSHYIAEGDLFTVETTVDGVSLPEFRHRMMWIDPDSGFAIGS
jgi:hypothetical protein